VALKVWASAQVSCHFASVAAGEYVVMSEVFPKSETPDGWVRRYS
jgi:hypothetical protein